MSDDLLIGMIVWLAMIVLSPIVSFFCVPKPFSKVQKIGILVSVLALVAVLLLPVVSIAGIVSLNFLDTMDWMTKQRGADEKELFEYFIPLLLAWFVSAPLISATLYMSNVAKSVGGLLMIVPPLYLVVLGHISSFLEKAGLASGSIVYLLCAILLVALPWIIRESKEQPQEKKRLRIILPVIVAFIGLAPALCTQVVAVMEKHSRTEARSKDDPDSIDVVKEVIAAEESNDENMMEMVSSERSFVCFVEGMHNVAYYTAHWLGEDYSETIVTQTYQYKSKDKYNIRAGVYKGSFDLRLSGDNIECSLNPGHLFDVIDVDGSTAFLFGQSDIDSDGVDELIIAGRTIQEKGNRICVNVYDMSRYKELGFPVKSVYNKTTYDGNMGVAFIEPANGERDGRITICREGTSDLDQLEIWYLQDGFEWIEE